MKRIGRVKHFGKWGLGVVLSLVLGQMNCAVYSPGPSADMCLEKAAGSNQAVLTFDVTREQLQDQALRFQNNGFYPGDIDVYEKQNQKYYAVVWNRNIVTEWTVHNVVDVSRWADFQEEWNRRRAKQWRLREVEIFEEAGVRRILAIWHQGSYDTKFRANIRPTEFPVVLEEMRRQGYFLVDFEAYRARNQVLFVTVWREERREQEYVDVASPRSFEDTHRRLKGQGYSLIDFEIYQSGQTKHYTGVWRRGGGETRLWMEADCVNFGAKFTEFAQSDLKLIDVEVDFDSAGNMLFSGVWSTSAFSR